jgi:hypothetical protein
MPRSSIEWTEMIAAIIILPAVLFVSTLYFGLIGFLIALVISASALNALKRIDHRRRQRALNPPVG